MWKPLLTGALARCAIDTAIEIGGQLNTLQQSEEFCDHSRNSRDATLASGASGVALCLAYLADAGVHPAGLVKADELFEFCADTMASATLNPSLHDGFAGIAWVARRLHLSHEGLAETDSLSEIDSELLDRLSRSSRGAEFDLISGLAGIGLYVLSRLPRATARECLVRVVDNLADMAEAAPSGITWHTGPELLTAQQRETFPAGHYNLGLAHGVPGVIGFLGQACASNVMECNAKARDLLSGAVSWLLSNRQTGSSQFRYYAGPAVELRGGRSAWCYGDPGVASALLVAARSAKEPEFEREAISLALHAARRPADQSGVIDPGLCHGAAGLAHMFNRLFQSTRDPAFSRAAIFWFEITLEMRKPGTGFAGFSSAVKLGENELVFRRDPSFLTGAAGIASALAAAVTAVEPEWDQVFMLSPVRS
ncbi:MAG: lanthionine synthetase C family protein [Acidobacteria bacterium]|nr:lanthionine synthetase C family protein [Acidobacteriota bacterium]